MQSNDTKQAEMPIICPCCSAIMEGGKCSKCGYCDE